MIDDFEEAGWYEEKPKSRAGWAVFWFVLLMVVGFILDRT